MQPRVFFMESQTNTSPDFLTKMFEIFVGDEVYYTTADQTLAKDTIKSIASKKERGRVRHIYTLYNGLSKLEGELFLSLKRAKDHFERCHISVTIPKGLEVD